VFFEGNSPIALMIGIDDEWKNGWGRKE